MVHITCPDRKGLVYDVMRTLHDANTRVACGCIATQGGRAELELYVQDSDRQRCSDACVCVGLLCVAGPLHREMLAELQSGLRTAAVLPVRLSVGEVFDGICTELVCTAYIDVGGRGRPRVTYDVTAALSALHLRVFQADIFWVSDAQLASDGGLRLMHANAEPA